jgi:hypothetical protein
MITQQLALEECSCTPDLYFVSKGSWRRESEGFKRFLYLVSIPADKLDERSRTPMAEDAATIARRRKY